MNHSSLRKVTLLLALVLVVTIGLSQLAIAYQSRWKALQGIKSISIAAYISNNPEIKHPSQTELIDCMKHALGDIKIESKKEGVPELRLYIRYCTDDKKQWVACITELQLSKVVETTHGLQQGTFWHDSDLASRKIDPKFNDYLLHRVEAEVKEFVEDYKLANSTKP